MVTLDLVDPAQQTFFYRARGLGVLVRIASIGLQFATDTTILCVVALIALLQCLVSL